MLYSIATEAPSDAFRRASLPRGKSRTVPVRADLGLAIAARTQQPEMAYTALRGLTQFLQSEAAVPATRAAVARLADFLSDLRLDEVAAIQHSLEHSRAWPGTMLELIATNEVMESLGRGENVAAMVNSACSSVHAHRQA